MSTSESVSRGGVDVRSRVVKFAALIYVDLWVLEGAFRKWVPGADHIFYVARDALAICIILLLIGLGRSKIRSSAWFWIYALVLLIVAAVQVMGDSVSLPIAVAGLRSYVAPWLLAVICLMQPGAVTASALATRVLIYAPLEIALTVAQVALPPDSVLNAEVSGEVTQFVSDGIPRATGTFTSPVFFVAYLTLAFSLALARSVQPGDLRRGLAVLALVGLTLSAGLSGSRSAVVSIGIVLVAFAVYVLARGQGRALAALFGVVLSLLAVLLALSMWFGNVVSAFLARFEAASRAEDTGARVLRQMFGFFSAPVTVLGDGIGSHSQAGIALGSANDWIEIETIRWVTELGVLGFTFAIVLTGVVVLIGLRTFLRLRVASLQHTLVVATSLPVFIAGQITQSPSSQAAAAVLIALLVLTWNEVVPVRSHDAQSPVIDARSNMIVSHR